MTEDLFDWVGGVAARDEAMALVDEHADEDWKDAASAAVLGCALHMELFTADDVMAGIPPEVTTHEKRALGPVMVRAAKAGWIVKAEMKAEPCKRRSRHAAPLTVWRSLLWEGTDAAARPVEPAQAEGVAA